MATCKLITPNGRVVEADGIRVRESRATYWDPGDYEEDWDYATLMVDGTDVDPYSWRGRILMDWLSENGEVKNDDY